MKLSSKIISLIEQVCISGANFIFLIGAARFLSGSTLGALTFALAIILVLQGFQRAFVIVPMMTSDEDLRTAAAMGGWSNIQFYCSVLVLAMLALMWFALSFFDTWVVQSLAISSVLILPSFYLEYVRRVLIKCGVHKRFIWAAASYAVTMLLGLACAYYIHVSNLYSYVAIMFLSSLFYIGFGFSRILPNAWPNKIEIKGWSWPQLYQFGKWAAASSIAYSGYNFAVQAVLGWVAGPVAVGIWGAARNLIQPMATFLQAMDSIDKQKMAKAYALNGVFGIDLTLKQAWQWLFGMAICYTLCLLVFGHQLVNMAYGNKFPDLISHVYWWLFVMFAMLFVQPLESALYVVRRPDLLFYGRMIAAGITMCIVYFLVMLWSINGALFSLGLGWLISGAVVLFQLRVIRRNQASVL